MSHSKVNQYFPGIDVNQMKNFISQYNDDNLLLVLSNVLKRLEQTMHDAQEVISFTLTKWQNLDCQALNKKYHNQVILGLIKTHQFRQAKIQDQQFMCNIYKYQLDQKEIFDDVETIINAQMRIQQQLQDLYETYDNDGFITPKRKMSHKLPVAKMQKTISVSLDISSTKQIEKLYKKNEVLLQHFGLKLDKKKLCNNSTQTELNMDFQKLKTPKQNIKENPLDMFSMYEDSVIANSVQYLPNYETEKRLTQDINQFLEEIENYYKKHDQNFNRLINEIAIVVERTFPGAKVDVYGSYATKLCLPHSDIDLVIKLQNFNMVYQADLLRNLDIQLRECKFIEETKCITQSTTPVLRVKCSKAYIYKRLDISIQENKHNGIQCVNLIKDYIRSYPPLKPLTLILKHFLHCSDLSDTYQGGLSSYGLILMIVSYLQSYQQQDNNWASLGTLLIGFLSTFGCDMDYFGKAIIPLPPNEDDEIIFCFNPNQLNPHNTQQQLIIIDPLNKTNNVGRPTYNVSKLKLAFTIAFVKLLTYDQNQISPLKAFFNCARNIQSSIQNFIQNFYSSYIYTNY
ncbi:hypothetical protein pb186bvf_008686 [Paramecium bursaria]